MAGRLTLLGSSNAAVHNQSARMRSASPAASRLLCRSPNPKSARLAVPRMVSASAGGLAHPSEEGSREDAASIRPFDAAMRLPTHGMAKGLGSFSGGATLEKSKLDMSQKLTQSSPKLDDSGGGGGIGGKIFNGGGGGDDGGDDDDYFGDFDGEEGDGGDGGFFRVVLPELYDRITINAVLSEWFRTVADLPLVLRQAVTMGLFSSAQLVRFLSMDVRPNLVRAVSRSASPEFSREFVGRLMADPAFAQKLAIEQAITAGGSVFYEWRHRGEDFVKELDFVVANTLTLMMANAALVWSVAPNRSYGAANKLPWQSMLSGLPNNVFDRNGPLRSYTNTTRAAGFLAKSAELSAIGAVAGAAQAGLGKALVAVRQSQNPRFEPSVPVPDVSRSALGMGAFMGLSSNLRYQLMGGVDRYLFDHSQMLWSYLAVSSSLRAASQYVGNGTRLVWQGLPTAVRPRLPQASQRQVVRRVRKTRAKRAASASAASGEAPARRPAGGFEMSATAPGAVAPPPVAVV